MKKQHGFTLVEVAMVLVIMGLLIGGVIKGQELMDSAKAKGIASDFRNVAVYLYGYQDKYRALPGDDPNAASRIAGAANSSSPANCGSSGKDSCLGNGQLDGNWDPSGNTEETYLLWQHLRLAGFLNGPTYTGTTVQGFLPHNNDGGVMGVESGNGRFIRDPGTDVTTYLSGSYLVCSRNIKGKVAKQVDIALDDGNPQTGALRVVTESHVRGDAAPATVDDSGRYTVCQAL